jgi:hypothetical protein
MAMTGHCGVLFGGARHGLGLSGFRGSSSRSVYCISGANGAPSGAACPVSCCHDQGELATGDRVGALLGLDAGWLRFGHNGKRRGPGYTEGVMGPLAPLAPPAQLDRGPRRQKATALPGAGCAGGADELWCW